MELSSPKSASSFGTDEDLNDEVGGKSESDDEPEHRTLKEIG